MAPFPLRNDRGFSLVEIVISLFIISLTAIMLSSVLVWTFQMAAGFETLANEEQERLSAENALRSVFLRAVDLEFAGSDINNDLGGAGLVRPFDSDLVWNQTPGTHTIAKFWREEQRSAAPNTPLPAGFASVFRKTGIFFQKPTENTWGVLYIDSGEATLLQPDPGDLKFEGLTRLRVTNFRTHNPAGSGVLPGQPVKSFDIEMTFRRFIVPDSESPRYVFCPRARMNVDPGCAYSAPTRDVVRTIRVMVRNNILAFSPSAPPGAPTTGPIFGARGEDLIHFFKPATPGDFL